MSEDAKQLIDLSHSIEHGLITYQGLPAPFISDYLSREQSKKLYDQGTEFQIGKIEMVANTGTYIDSPFHRFAEGPDLAEMPLEKSANLDGVVISVAEDNDRSIVLEKSDLAGFKGKAVLFHTGWSRHWNTSQYFEDYPYLTRKTAVNLRDIGVTLVGIDSLNIDDNRDGARPVHTILLEAGIPVVEHLTNLHLLPKSGCRFFATPVKVRDFGSFPVRAFALLPAEK